MYNLFLYYKLNISISFHLKKKKKKIKIPNSSLRKMFKNVSIGFHSLFNTFKLFMVMKNLKFVRYIKYSFGLYIL